MTKITEQASSKAINRVIGNVKRSGAAFNNGVQEACILIIRHAEMFGDCTAAERLVSSMPKSMKRGQVCTYLSLYSPINCRRVKEGGTGGYKASFRDEESKAYNPFNLEAAEANPWYDMESAKSEPKVYSVSDVQDEIEKLVKRLNKAVKEDRVAGDISDRLRILANAAKDFVEAPKAEQTAEEAEALPLAEAA